MTKKLPLILTFFIILFLLSGCTNSRIRVTHPDVRSTQDNTWNNNDAENVDISDLDENLTETETIITEDMAEERMERIPFPVSEYNRFQRSGKGTVKGSIYIDNAHNQKVMGAGTRLYLNPVTTYSKQWYNESYLGGYKMEKADQRLFNHLRFTAAANSGEFAFYGVPSGSYYLIGTVKCAEECGYSTPKSIRIATTVSVYGSQIVRRDLSRLID